MASAATASSGIVRPGERVQLGRGRAQPRVVWVYPAYAQGRIDEEEAYAARMRADGADVRAFGIPCPGGWWPFPVLDQCYRQGERSLHEAYAALARLLDDADVLVAAGGAMLHPEFLDQLRVHKLFVCADDPENSANLSQPVAAHFDHCFVVNIACVDAYRDWGCRSVEWLFPVLRPERVTPKMTRQRIVHGGRDLDLALCCDRDFGTGDRAQRLANLLAEFPQCETRGRGWPQGPIPPSEVAALYARSKIGWNLHHSVGPCNTRLLELPANGVLQICDNGQQLGRIFALDREVVGFDTIAECIDKTRYYLAHDDERRAIAVAGAERVQRDYTEPRQWQRILAAIDRLRPTPAASAPAPALPITAAVDNAIDAAKAAVIPSRRPRVWLLADRRGWAYDRLCHGVARELANEFDCRIAYVAERPDLTDWDFDLVLVCYWGETWHQQFVSDPARIVKLVSSHRWQEASHGALTPAQFAATHLTDAATLGATSLRLQHLLAAERAVLHTPQGVELDTFVPPTTRRHGPLVAGWAGNAQDPCKGLALMLRPATGDDFELRSADGSLDAAGMVRFYQGIDVLLIASTFEGEPRPLLEAMACGCFPIAVDVGIVPELVHHADNGLIVERNPAAFRAALQWCAANLDFVRAAGARNRDLLATARAWPTVAAGWRELLRTAWDRLRARPLAPTVPTVLPAATPATVARRDRDADVIAACKNDYSPHLDAVNRGHDDDTWRAASAYYRCELLPLLPAARDAAVLDVGTGFGYLLRFLHERGYRNLGGVELDADLCRRTRARLGTAAVIHHGDALALLAGSPQRYDLITAWDIVEHFALADCLEFLRLLRRALRPGGTLVLRTPNMANVLGIYSRCMDLTHQVGFTEQSLAQLLRQAGFDDAALHVPDFTREATLAAKVAESRAFHARLFESQDRATPGCFDKNLVMQASVPALLAVPPVTAAGAAR